MDKAEADEEATMRVDLYTKGVLTVIAAALVYIGVALAPMGVGLQAQATQQGPTSIYGSKPVHVVGWMDSRGQMHPLPTVSPLDKAGSARPLPVHETYSPLPDVPDKK